MLIIRRPLNPRKKDRLVAGLTGSIGSGKSAAAEILKESGCIVLHADQMASQVLQSESLRPELERLFGNRIFREDGSLSREEIASQVFSDREKRERLNSLIHPEVRSRFSETAASLKKGEILLYDIPLLFETGGEDTFDVIISVIAPTPVRQERVKKRNQMGADDFRKRDRTQTSADFKFLHSDAVILNDQGMAELQRSVISLGEILKASLL